MIPAFNVTPFALYNILMGVAAAVGIGYLVYTQLFVLEYRRFLVYLGTGFLVFSIAGPLADLVAPDWAHLVHGVATLFVVFGLYNPIHNEIRTDEWMRLLFREPSQIRHPREWMRPLDEQILEVFHVSGLVLTPSIVAYNIDYSTKEVNRRLSELVAHDLVERVDRGKYRMTDMGEQYLQGNFSVS